MNTKTMNTTSEQRRNWFRPKEEPTVIAGPCSAETEEQVYATCRALAKNKHVNILRAGIWKPRTRPGSFEGIGVQGLPWMKKMKEETGLPVTIEVAKAGHVEACLDFDIDMLWIGARTSVNPFAVQEIAEALRGVDIPVLVKNPINPDLSLWIGAVERLQQVGVKQIGSIHRGFSNTSEKLYRNRPQWQLAIDFMHELPNIPLICDPSHICGNRELLQAVSQKAIDLNYDGLMVESHIDPSNAWSDAKQQITPESLYQMIESMVLRTSSEEDSKKQTQLEFMRQDINEIDTDIINLLGERMNIARQIGEYKKKEKITILQPKRWDSIMQRMLQLAEKNQLSEEFVASFIKTIHQESINQQEQIMSGK